MQNKVTKYHPILFSTPMVQAILQGRKTQTRRTKGLEKYNKNPEHYFFNYSNERFWAYKKTSRLIDSMVKCPYKVGDVLWVRENFFTPENWDHWKPSALASLDVNVYYQADIGNEYIPQLLHRGKIRPCIFLPSHYCRIFLKIKSIRIERLMSISSEDARAEGVEYVEGIKRKLYYDYITMNHGCNELYSFMSLWKSINGYDSLDKNPFVWVYEFEKIEKPLDFK